MQINKYYCWVYQKKDLTVVYMDVLRLIGPFVSNKLNAAIDVGTGS